jgi:N-methylhydantoinase B
MTVGLFQQTANLTRGKAAMKDSTQKDPAQKDPALKADPATFEIVKNSLTKIAEEMRVVLAKTAYSPILKSAGDYSCGVFDARGEMVAQGPDLPIHLGSMPDAVRAVVAVFASDVHDGDVFVHNDPYFGGSHLPDVNVVRPAFHDGRLLGYACLRAHWPDVGSATPGSYGAVTEIFGEGLRIPPLRLISRGALNVDLEKLILANVRTPDERKGDLGAQLAATLRAAERLKALARRYGGAELIDYMAQVMDYSERLMRAALMDLPDGEGAFEDFCDGDGIADDASGADARFRICLSVKKTADRLVVDFAGTDRQVKGPMNAPLSVTASGVYCGLKTAVDPNNLIPPNSGCWRSIEVRAPKGSVVNAEFPAPVVYANHEISHRVADMVMGALVNFMPEQVMACSQGTSAILTLGGVDPRSGRHYVSYETMKGGFGARPNKDGINCIASGISNTMNTPVEVLEMAFPVRVERYEVNPDSGGAGRYRGGCGARRVWRMLEGADATGALCMERMTSPPFGLRGGKAGAAAVVTLTTPDGVTRHLPSKGAFAAPAGSVIDMITPGSGGFGPVAERNPAAIGRDLLDGYVSAAAAQRDYGTGNPEALRKMAASEDEA